MGPVARDKMQHGIKPIAVESKAHLLTIPCIGTNQYRGGTSNTLMSHIQHNPCGCYIDPQATRIKCTLQFMFSSELAPSDTLKDFSVSKIIKDVCLEISTHTVRFLLSQKSEPLN